jgi:hypothetical protein
MSDDTDANQDNRQRELELHQRMIASDPIAPAEIAEFFLLHRQPTLPDILRGLYPQLADPHVIDMAVDDALLDYLKQPDHFDPDIIPLCSFLRMVADRNVRNLIHPTKLQSHTIQMSDFVELDASGAEYELDIQDDFDLEDYVAIRNSGVWPRLREILPDERDRQVLRLMMEGIRDTSAYAEVLAISHLPAEDRTREVKRHKDRVKKHLQRHMRPEEFKNV